MSMFKSNHDIRSLRVVVFPNPIVNFSHKVKWTENENKKGVIPCVVEECTGLIILQNQSERHHVSKVHIPQEELKDVERLPEEQSEQPPGNIDGPQGSIEWQWKNSEKSNQWPGNAVSDSVQNGLELHLNLLIISKVSCFGDVIKGLPWTSNNQNQGGSPDSGGCPHLHPIEIRVKEVSINPKSIGSWIVIKHVLNGHVLGLFVDPFRSWSLRVENVEEGLLEFKFRHLFHFDAKLILCCVT